MDVNATFHEERRNGGWGAISRDSTLDICVAAAGPLQMMDDAMHAEGTALFRAIDIADQMVMAG
jgi:hypothetical protein